MGSYEKEIINKLSSLEDILNRKEKKLLTFKEVCNYLCCAPSFLYKLTCKNHIPHYKPTGKKIFFLKNEVDNWATANSVNEKLWDDRN